MTARTHIVLSSDHVLVSTLHTELGNASYNMHALGLGWVGVGVGVNMAVTSGYTLA